MISDQFTYQTNTFENTYHLIITACEYRFMLLYVLIKHYHVHVIEIIIMGFYIRIDLHISNVFIDWFSHLVSYNKVMMVTFI